MADSHCLGFKFSFTACQTSWIFKTITSITKASLLSDSFHLVPVENCMQRFSYSLKVLMLKNLVHLFLWYPMIGLYRVHYRYLSLPLCSFRLINPNFNSLPCLDQYRLHADFKNFEPKFSLKPNFSIKLQFYHSLHHAFSLLSISILSISFSYIHIQVINIFSFPLYYNSLCPFL